MKNISLAVYENLTPRQRIIAIIEAEARDDQNEVQRLVRTCPKKTYRMTDGAFADAMQNLMGRSLAFELDMANLAITALFKLAIDENDPLPWINQMAALQAAWRAELESGGINPTSMAKAGCPRHCVVDALIGLATIQKWADRREPDGVKPTIDD